MADVLVGSHGFQDLVAHILGVAGRKADAHPGRSIGHDTEEVGKVDALLSREAH